MNEATRHPDVIPLEPAEVACVAEPFARAAALERQIGALLIELQSRIDELRAEHARELAAYRLARKDLFRRRGAGPGMELDLSGRRLFRPGAEPGQQPS